MGFLYYTDARGNAVEIINSARTAANLRSAGCGTFSNVLDSAGCDALNYQPCTRDPLTGETDSWELADFSIEGAPWYPNPGAAPARVEAASEAYGFYITEWTGLDGAHQKRSVSPLGRGGAFFGQQSAAHRTMKLNVMLVGESERGLTYLFRWLEEAILQCCRSCSEGQQLWFRETCPDDASNVGTEGLGRLNRVALLEGLTWENQPTEDSGCSIRMASFTLGAGDPCIYSAGEGLGSLARSTAGVTKSTSATVAPCGPLGASTRALWALAGDFESLPGRQSAVVRISSDAAPRSPGVLKPLPDLRISGYADLYGTFDPCSAAKIGEIVITGRNTSGLMIEVDIAARRVRYRTFNGLDEWQDGSKFIAPRVAGGPKRWWTWEDCPAPFIVIEPVYVGLLNSVEGLADPADNWTVSVDSLYRYGCC